MGSEELQVLLKEIPYACRVQTKLCTIKWKLRYMTELSEEQRAQLSSIIGVSILRPRQASNTLVSHFGEFDIRDTSCDTMMKLQRLDWQFDEVREILGMHEDALEDAALVGEANNEHVNSSPKRALDCDQVETPRHESSVHSAENSNHQDSIPQRVRRRRV